MKVGDNWTVPLCGVHHEELHGFGDELLYWMLYGIDPFKIARDLWNETENKKKDGKKKSRKRSQALSRDDEKP